jgi:hypothetical protein
MATVRFYPGHWVADYYDANKRRRIERPEGHFEKATQELHAAQIDPQARRLAIAFSTALTRSRASSFKSRRET